VNLSSTDLHRVVVKLGTQIVMEGQSEPAFRRLEEIALALFQAWKVGREVLVVSSGAVGSGRRQLGLFHELDLVEKQACAAVGQALLMETYRTIFQRHGVKIAQVLLTTADFSERKRYLRLRRTLEKLLEMRVIPIINENDTVSTMELKEGVYSKSFGDNDRLSALVAGKLGADLLIILTDVDGIYTSDPKTNADARLLKSIERFEQLADIRLQGSSVSGRGGMASKLEAARIASISGVDTLIASGIDHAFLSGLLTGGRMDPVAARGTFVPARAGLSGRKRWIGFASGVKGAVTINEGAIRALIDAKASLLAVGVIRVDGAFQPGDVVSLRNQNDQELGRGISNYAAGELERIAGQSSQRIAQTLSRSGPAEIIHRDNLVIFWESV
jgi:glutamate 5-kinase